MQGAAQKLMQSSAEVQCRGQLNTWQFLTEQDLIQDYSND